MERSEILSTRHDLRMVSSGWTRQGVEKIEPVAILDYNSSKQGVDKSDQMASYHSQLRKTLRWYHKVAFELILNTRVVNSRLIFNKPTKKNLRIKHF